MPTVEIEIDENGHTTTVIKGCTKARPAVKIREEALKYLESVGIDTSRLEKSPINFAREEAKLKGAKEKVKG